MAGLALCVCCGNVMAQEQERDEDPAEWEEGIEILPWLTLFGSLELERESLYLESIDGAETTEREGPFATVTLGIDLRPLPWLGARWVVEKDSDLPTGFYSDEAFVYLAADRLGASAGLQYLPFGSFDTVFGTDAFTEIGEVRADSVLVAGEATDAVTLSAYFIDGEFSEDGDGEIDYGVSMLVRPSEDSWWVGAGYLSDLAETRAGLIESALGVRGARAGGFNLYGGLPMGDFLLLGETVFALERIGDLDREFDRPFTAMLELDFELSETLILAARWETSRELEDVPRYRYGASIQWLPGHGFGIGLDLLYGTYQRGRAFDEQDRELDNSWQYLVEVSFEF